ncbi:MAG: hypothetical protein M3R36_01805 [Bacteroidota bacterium]|nr:hypothetical protein [Bacteroidota bacterium]
MKKQILDCENVQESFKNVKLKVRRIERAFIATALHYSHFVDNSLTKSDIYNLRDHVIYRFNSLELHIQLLLMHHHSINEQIKKILKNDPQELLRSYNPIHPYFNKWQQDVSCIFDSLIYHMVSIFDYISTLINYICGSGKDKQQNKKWTNLTKMALDSKHTFSSTLISKTIVKTNNSFVDKLYEHRSFLIHNKTDLSGFSFKFDLIGGEIFSTNFLATKRFVNQFSDLKKMIKENPVTIKYVAFWLIQETINTISELLLDLKKEMELSKEIPVGMLLYLDSETNQLYPSSFPDWKEADLENIKMNPIIN